MAALNLSFPSVKWEAQWGHAGSGTVVRGRALRQPAWVLSLAPASQGPGQGPSPRGSVCSCQVGVITLGGLGESRSGPVTSTWVSTRICSSGNASCRPMEVLRAAVSALHPLPCRAAQDVCSPQPSPALHRERLWCSALPTAAEAPQRNGPGASVSVPLAFVTPISGALFS